MEINVVSESKKEFIFETKGLVGHTFYNLIKEALYKDKDVEAASYTIEHPLVQVPKFIIQTNGKTSPRAALIKAIKSVKLMNSKIEKEIIKAIK